MNPNVQTIGGFEIVSPEQEQALRNMQKFHEMFEESPNPLAHFRTRLGRHPQESRSKYNGDGSLK
jgi:hypothetical protein